DTHGPAGGTPASTPDQGLQPGQYEDRAHTDAREGHAHGQAAPAYEPVREKERLTSIAQTVGTPTDKHTECGIQVPWLVYQWGQHQPSGHESHPHLDYCPWPTAIHQAADAGAQGRRDEEAKRKRPSRHASLPAELVENRREEQRKGGARVDAQAHSDKGNSHD